MDGITANHLDQPDDDRTRPRRTASNDAGVARSRFSDSADLRGGHSGERRRPGLAGERRRKFRAARAAARRNERCRRLEVANHSRWAAAAVVVIAAAVAVPLIILTRNPRAPLTATVSASGGQCPKDHPVKALVIFDRQPTPWSRT